MGNDGERKTNFDLSKYKQQQFQQNQHHYPISNQHQQRSGLLPTDEQDAYKRSSNRASRRSRAERTSYLMATGHLDPDETQRLNGHIEDTILTEPPPPITSPSSNTAFMQRDISDQQHTSHQGSRVSTKRSNFEQSFLDDLNRTLANSPVTSQNLKYQHGDYRSVHNTSKSSRKKDDSGRKSKRQATSKVKAGSQSTTTDNDNLGRSKFRQTYTEVALPMKTSPAFEYILKDNRRRNKRCCLWFLYSILMTICLLVIIWASIMISRSAHK